MENTLLDESIFIIMKKISKILLVLLVVLGLQLNAQKVGVVDTEYILNQLPKYNEAKGRLDAQIKTWQKEITALQSEYEQKKSAFENEKVLLVGEQLKQREKEVLDLEKNIKTTIALRFGKNGEAEELRETLVKPFQDKIFNAIRKVFEKRRLGMVLDKNSNNVLFLNKRYDYTERVLDELLDRKKKKKRKKRRRR